MQKFRVLMVVVAALGLVNPVFAETKTPTKLTVKNARSVTMIGIWLAAPADKDLAVQSNAPLPAGGVEDFIISKDHACQQNILVHYADASTAKGTIDLCKVKSLTLR